MFAEFEQLCHKYVEEGGSLTAQWLCDEYDKLNRTYFGRIFKETVGKSPQQFLLNYRMTKAAELLKLTNLSISDIGNAVGYPNQLHFSRAFKNVFGISPREWRNKNHVMK